MKINVYNNYRYKTIMFFIEIMKVIAIILRVIEDDFLSKICESLITPSLPIF